MRKRLDGDYELDDDPGRIDVDRVHAFLASHSYWARDRARETVATSLAGSARVVGLYYRSVQVGLARVISDGATHAYLADVYVEEAHRGVGLGKRLVAEAVERGPHRDLKWLLHTADAHALYMRYGFLPASERVLEREARGASATPPATEPPRG